MKKLLCTLAALTCAINLVACGSSSGNSKANDDSNVSVLSTNTEKSDEEIRLPVIANWATDIWNEGFDDISTYVKTGKSAVGQTMDVQFTIDNLKLAYSKKDTYNDYIQSLDDSVSEQAQLINAWNKMIEQADILYNKVVTETPQANDPNYELDIGLFYQYFMGFYNLAWNIENPVFK